jgi:hypothetical protein
MLREVICICIGKLSIRPRRAGAVVRDRCIRGAPDQAGDGGVKSPMGGRARHMGRCLGANGTNCVMDNFSFM